RQAGRSAGAPSHCQQRWPVPRLFLWHDQDIPQLYWGHICAHHTVVWSSPPIPLVRAVPACRCALGMTTRSKYHARVDVGIVGHAHTTEIQERRRWQGARRRGEKRGTTKLSDKNVYTTKTSKGIRWGGKTCPLFLLARPPHCQGRLDKLASASVSVKFMLSASRHHAVCKSGAIL